MRQYLVLTRSFWTMNTRIKATLFWNIAFPVGLLLLYGTIWGDQTFGSVQALPWLLAGTVVLNIIASGLLGDSAWLTAMRDRGVLLRVHASPIPPAVLVAAYASVRLLLVILQALLLVVTGLVVFGVPVLWQQLAISGSIILLGAAVFIVLGQAIAAATPNAATANTVGQACYFALLFLSNLFIPIDRFPEWLQALARWSPAYMLVDLLRPALVAIPANQAAWINLAGLLVYGVLSLGIAARFFQWEPRD